MVKKWLMSILLVNNLNYFKQKIPLIKWDFLFGNIQIFNSSWSYNKLYIR